MGKHKGKKGDDQTAKIQIIAEVLKLLTAMLALITALIKALSE